MSRRAVLFLAVAPLLAALPLTADAGLSRTGSSDVSFTAYGPAGMSIHGTTSELAVADGGQSVVVTVPVKTLVTGIGVRDKHMRDALEADKYMTAALTVVKSALRFPEAGADTTVDAEGTMTLHGQTRAIKFHYTARRDATTYAVKGSARVHMADFGITPPSYLGISVKPDVDVEVKFSVVDK